MAPSGLTKEAQTELKAADALRDAGQFDQAIAAYEGIRSKNPSLSTFNIEIAGTYRQKAAKETDHAACQASLDKALASYQEMLKADPNNERATIDDPNAPKAAEANACLKGLKQKSLRFPPDAVALSLGRLHPTPGSAVPGARP